MYTIILLSYIVNYGGQAMSITSQTFGNYKNASECQQIAHQLTTNTATATNTAPVEKDRVNYQTVTNYTTARCAYVGTK